MRNAGCMTRGIIGGIEVTVLYTTMRNNSKMLPQNIEVSCEEVQTAAALCTSRTAAQKSSRFRDIGINAEANNREDNCPKLLPS